MLSHAGFDGLRELGDVLQGGLVGRRVRVRIERFNRAALPESEGLATWLDDKWIEIDGWIDGQLKQLSEGS